MPDDELPKDDWTEVAMEDSRYRWGTVTPTTRIGEDDKGLFLYEDGSTTFTRTGPTAKRRRTPDERPEDPISTGLSGPEDLNVYHETDWLHRVTVRRDTMDLIESRYPPIKEHVPLRLLLQYILFNRYAIGLHSTWDGEGAPLKATMLASMAGCLDQYQSNNFRAEDMLWWAKDELFDGEFSWTDWSWHPDPGKRRYRRIADVTLPPDVKAAVEWEVSHPISEASDRVWFDTGTAHSAQSSLDLRKSIFQRVQSQGAKVFNEKGNPKIPQAIQNYLNALPINGFNKVVRDHLDEAQSAVEALPNNSLTDRRGKRNARMVLRYIEECPKPFYHAKLKSPRLFAPHSLQLVAREVRNAFVQDWTMLDLSSAQLAVCAREWDVTPLLNFLNDDDGDIWEELTSWMDLPKSAIKKALYAIIFGAQVDWTYGSPPSTLNDALIGDSEMTSKEADQARRRLLSHPLMSSIYEAREKRIEEIREQGYIRDCFGTVMSLPSETTRRADDDVTVLTLLSAELSAVEMLLLWPAFEEVIGEEKRCKIMLYLFDGVSIKVANPQRVETWVDKLQSAVNDQADALDIPTRLVRE